MVGKMMVVVKSQFSDLFSSPEETNCSIFFNEEQMGGYLVECFKKMEE